MDTGSIPMGTPACCFAGPVKAKCRASCCRRQHGQPQHPGKKARRCGGLKVQGGGALTIKRHYLSLRFGCYRQDRITTGSTDLARAVAPLPPWETHAGKGCAGAQRVTVAPVSAACSPPWLRLVATCNCRRSAHTHPKRDRALRSVQVTYPDPVKSRSRRRSICIGAVCPLSPRRCRCQSFRVSSIYSVDAGYVSVRLTP